MIIALNDGYTVKKIYDLTQGNIDQLLYKNQIVMERGCHHIVLGECRNTRIAHWVRDHQPNALKRILADHEYVAGIEEWKSEDSLEYIVDGVRSGETYCGEYLIKP